MNKNELISRVSESSGLTKADASRAVDSVLESIQSSLSSKEEVRLAGFGTFTVSHRKATTGRNPRTGAPIQIAASNMPKFRPGKGLREAVN